MNSEDYKLIPMSDITDEAREIAVAWMECEDKDWIGQKHKLASDIMNYAKKQNAEMTEVLRSVNAYFVQLQNRGGLTYKDENTWKKVSKILNKK